MILKTHIGMKEEPGELGYVQLDLILLSQLPSGDMQ